MALNFTISYTFSPSTVISSSQVNTNESDIAGVFTGLEAGTKTLALLKMDNLPATSTEVATKAYTDKLNNYRRPVLQYASGSVVNLETGINGTSGQAQILFPDGTIRTDSTSGRINCTMSQTAAFSGSAQSGIDTGSVAANTWYSFYAAKVTDSSANFVVTASLLTPTQGNYATLNTRFGSNGWVYLGSLPYGDNSGATTAIPKFVMAGNQVSFGSACAGNSRTLAGIRLATSAGATSTTWTYAAGGSVSSAQIPAHILIGTIETSNESAGTPFVSNAGQSVNYAAIGTGAVTMLRLNNVYLADGIKMSTSASVAQDITFAGFIDGVLGIGANPSL